MKGLNAVMVDPLPPCLPNIPDEILLQWDTDEEYLATCLEQWEAKEPPSNKAQLELEV